MRTAAIVLCLIYLTVCPAMSQIRVQAKITTHTDSSTKAVMSDTSYLRNLSGDYLISNLGPEVINIKVSSTKQLQVNIPDRGEYELKAITPELFDVKGLQKVRIIFFLDRFGQSRAINIIDKQEEPRHVKNQINGS